MKSDLSRLQKQLAHRFAHIEHLYLALTHCSVGAKNNERLEFLGDALLNCTIAEALYHRFPNAKEGILTRLRAQLVCERTLAEMANEMQLGHYLRMGSGELKSGGFKRASILSDALEALIAAIYLDAGMDACRSCILAWFDARLQQASEHHVLKDAKTRLQEYQQARKKTLPTYVLIAVTGQAHAQSFTTHCYVDALEEPSQGMGSSRKIAEQEAARQALEQLEAGVSYDD